MVALNDKLQYSNKKRINRLLNLIKEEINKPISFYNIHKLSKILKISNIPKLDALINFIREKGYIASRTHFDFLSIKTNMDINTIKETLLELKIN